MSAREEEEEEEEEEEGLGGHPNRQKQWLPAGSAADSLSWSCISYWEGVHCDHKQSQAYAV
jgi:hypothetical protein